MSHFTASEWLSRFLTESQSGSLSSCTCSSHRWHWSLRWPAFLPAQAGSREVQGWPYPARSLCAGICPRSTTSHFLPCTWGHEKRVMCGRINRTWLLVNNHQNQKMTTVTKTEPPPLSILNLLPPLNPRRSTHFPTWFQCLVTILHVEPDFGWLWQPQKTHLQVAFPSSTTQTPSLRHSTPVQASVTGSDVLGWAVDGLVGVGVGWGTVELRWETSNQKHSLLNNSMKSCLVWKMCSMLCWFDAKGNNVIML